MGLTQITVTGTFHKANTTDPESGYVTFRLVAPLQDPAGNVIVPSTTTVMVLDPSGHIEGNLAATDTPGNQPTGLTYKVVEHIDGSQPRSYNLTIPYNAPGSTVDLADLAPAVTSPMYQYALVSHTHENLAESGGGAGGVLSGNYPNPGFAQDMATQAELNAHASLPHSGINSVEIAVGVNGLVGGFNPADEAIIESLIDQAGPGGTVIFRKGEWAVDDLEVLHPDQTWIVTKRAIIRQKATASVKYVISVKNTGWHLKLHGTIDGNRGVQSTWDNGGIIALGTEWGSEDIAITGRGLITNCGNYPILVKGHRHVFIAYTRISNSRAGIGIFGRGGNPGYDLDDITVIRPHIDNRVVTGVTPSQMVDAGIKFWNSHLDTSGRISDFACVKPTVLYPESATAPICIEGGHGLKPTITSPTTRGGSMGVSFNTDTEFHMSGHQIVTPWHYGIEMGACPGGTLGPGNVDGRPTAGTPNGTEFGIVSTGSGMWIGVGHDYSINGQNIDFTDSLGVPYYFSASAARIRVTGGTVRFGRAGVGSPVAAVFNVGTDGSGMTGVTFYGPGYANGIAIRVQDSSHMTFEANTFLRCQQVLNLVGTGGRVIDYVTLTGNDIDPAIPLILSYNLTGGATAGTHNRFSPNSNESTVAAEAPILTAPTDAMFSLGNWKVGDAFNRADTGAGVGLGTTTSGKPYSYFPRSGGARLGILDTQAYQPGAPGANSVEAVDTGTANGRMVMRIGATGFVGRTHGHFRMVDIDNLWTFGHLADSAILTKTVAGVATNVYGPIGNAVVGEVFEVRYNGGSITLFRNGVQVFTGTDTTHQAATWCGLSLAPGAQRIDWWAVEAL